MSILSWGNTQPPFAKRLAFFAAINQRLLWSVSMCPSQLDKDSLTSDPVTLSVSDFCRELTDWVFDSTDNSVITTDWFEDYVSRSRHRLLLCLGNSRLFAQIFLTCFHLQHPLAIVSVESKDEECEIAIRNACPEYAIASAGLCNRLTRCGFRLVKELVPHKVSLLYRTPVPQSPEAQPNTTVIFSSGSTGYPKAIVLHNSRMLRNARAHLDSIRSPGQGAFSRFYHSRFHTGSSRRFWRLRFPALLCLSLIRFYSCTCSVRLSRNIAFPLFR